MDFLWAVIQIFQKGRVNGMVEKRLGNKLSKRDFIAYIANLNNITLQEAGRAYDIVIGGIIDAAKAGLNLSLMGFGVFYLQDHNGHPVQFKGENKTAGERTYTPKYKVFKFSASKALNIAIRKADAERSAGSTAKCDDV